MVKDAQEVWARPAGEGTSEPVSALMDGELGSQDCLASIARMKSSPVWREDWATYHLIGDTLRQLPPLSGDFEQRVTRRLAAEPTALAPRRGRSIRQPLLALSAAASVAAIALATWQSVQPSPDLRAGAQLAENRNTASPPGAQPYRNVREYLIAHQEYSPSIAMQGVAPYARTAYQTQGNADR